MPVTPIPGDASQVVTGGTAIVAVAANPDGVNGLVITNPATAADQGFDPADTPEPLYVDAVTDATLEGNGTTFRIEPGGSWYGIAGQTTATSVNAATSGHKFSVTQW